MKSNVMMRSAEEWREWCRTIKSGPLPTGGRERVYESGVEFVETRLLDRDLWEDGSWVVEIGSGNGRIAMGLSNEPIRYLGLEPIADAVAFCRKAFAEFPEFSFEHLDVANAQYNPSGKTAPEQIVLPVDDGTVDLALAVSVFTHLETTAAAERYLAECRRILKPEGKLFSTWFRSPPNQTAAIAARTVYSEAWIIRKITERFEVLETSRGTTTGYHDQWEIVAGKSS